MLSFTKFLILKLSIITLISLSINTAKAADIYQNDSNKYRIYLDGEIRKGDAERLVHLLAPANLVIPSILFINSNGGDLMEAMKIVQLVKAFKLDVQVSNGGICASSCFFIYIAANNRFAQAAGVNDDGTLMPQELRNKFGGVVGIHRPYFKQIQNVNESPDNQEKMMKKVKEFLITENIPQYLIDEMMSRPSNDMYWLREKDLDAIGEYSAGVEELLINKCGYKRFSKILDEKWSEARVDLLFGCLNKILHSDDNSMLRKSIGIRLQSGWRPW